jgi:mono/diheme cytochrome c family protein
MKLRINLLKPLLAAMILLTWLPVQAQTLQQLPKVHGFAVGNGSTPWIYAATQGGLFTSRDGGKNWNNPFEFRFPVTAVEAASDGTLYAFVVTQGLLRFGKSDSYWVPVSNRFGGQVLTKLTVVPGAPVRFLAHNQFGKVLNSDDGGMNWSGSMAGRGQVSEQEKRGENLYNANCQSCHGVQGVGETYTEESLTTQGYIMAPALDDSTHAWHHTDDDLVKTILEGSDRTERMKAWKHELKDKDARDIVAYMKSLWSQRALDCQGPKHMQCM